MLEQQNKKLIYVFLITIYFFYFYEFFLRVFPSLLVNEMMREFSVTATSIGIMSAFYIFAYAPMQIPTGILIDKFDSKKMLFLAGIFCCFGSIIFGFSLNIFQASVSRFLIGLGSSFVFIIMIYMITHSPYAEAANFLSF